MKEVLKLIREFEDRFGTIHQLITGIGNYSSVGEITEPTFDNGEIEEAPEGTIRFSFDEIVKTHFKNFRRAADGLKQDLSAYMEREVNGRNSTDFALVWRTKPEIMWQKDFETNKVRWGYYTRLKILPSKVAA